MHLNAFLAYAFTALLTHVHARIFSGSAMEGLEEAANFQAEQLGRMRSFLGPAQSEEPQHSKRAEPIITFNNPKAKQFHVDGTKIPDGRPLLSLYNPIL
jgi:hypothetical protein